MEVSEDTIMDQLEHAAVLGEEPRRRKKKMKKSRRRKEVEPEPELTETEKLIKDMEKAPEEELDLDSVFIPDIESTMKKGKVDIMWESDEEDLVWLDKRFSEEAELLKLKHLKWRLETRRKKKEAALRMKKYMEQKAEDWELVKITQEHILVRIGGKLRKKKREIWKVKIKAAIKKSKKEGERKRVKEEERKRVKEEERKRVKAKKKEEKKVKKEEKTKPNAKAKPKTKAGSKTKSKRKKDTSVKDGDEDFSDDGWM
jgi:hypothetical protein